MSLPLATLPLAERWDCHQCGICCYGSIVRLSELDRQRLKEQGWDSHPDYRGIQTVVREGWFSSQYHLAQRDDGSCVFLMPDGLCRIHKEFGFEAKPLLCQMFPRQIIPLGDKAVLTIRRACPSAVQDLGRLAEEHLPDVVRTAAFQKVERPLDVHLTIDQGSCDRRTHARHGCEMDHQIDRLFLEEALEQRIVADVALSTAHTSSGPPHAQQALHMRLFDCRGIEIIEIIQTRDPMSLSPQPRTEMRPDKASSTCHQNVCNHVACQQDKLSLRVSLPSAAHVGRSTQCGARETVIVTDQTMLQTGYGLPPSCPSTPVLCTTHRSMCT